MAKANCVLFLIFYSGMLFGKDYVISTIAGGAPPVLSARAPDVVVGEPASITADGAGNVYFTGLSYLFKLDAAGILSRVAGNGRSDPLGDDGPATAASMRINAVVSDATGNLFVADGLNQRIRRITVDGIITTKAASTELAFISGLAIASDGSLFISDSYNKLIRKMTPESLIVTVAGGGAHVSDEPAPALDARLSGPGAIARNAEGDIYFADSYPVRIRKLSSDGMLTTIAGNGTDFDVEGGPALTAAIFDVGGIAVDDGGNIIFSEYNSSYGICSLGRCPKGVNRIRKISSEGILTTVAGLAPLSVGFSGDRGPALAAGLFFPKGVAFDAQGNLLIADSRNARIRRISRDATIETIAGNGEHYNLLAGDGGPAADAAMYNPSGLVFDKIGNLYIAEYGNNRIRKISPEGVISTVAGTGGQANDAYGDPGFSGDGGLATAAKLNHPVAVAIDHDDNLFIADSGNYRVRKVSSDGVITTVAGNGISWFPRGDIAINEPLLPPVGLAVDSFGNLFIATNFVAVYKLSRDGKIHLFTNEVGGSQGLAVDASDNLFIADYSNSRVLKIMSNGTVATVAGNSSRVSSGDGGSAVEAGIPYPGHVAVDRNGNLFIASDGHIRKVTSGGIITTVAGTGQDCACIVGEGGLATNAPMNPRGLAVDLEGNLYESEGSVAWIPNHVIRILRPVR